MSNLNLMNSGNWLPFYTPAAKAFNCNDSAIFFSKLINKYQYHEIRGELKDGWFFVTVQSIEEDINIKRAVQDRIIDTFSRVGLMEVKLMDSPPKRYFRLNIMEIEAFLSKGCPAEFVNERLSSNPKEKKRIRRNATIQIVETKPFKSSENDYSNSRNATIQIVEKQPLYYNTIIKNNSIETVIETKGDFSENSLERENEGLDLKAKNQKKGTRAGGGDGEATLSPDLKRLETGKAALTKASAKKAAKNDFRPVSVEISEALEDFGMLEVWERWRTYRWRMHKFQYFDDKSEKNALNSLMQKARNQSDVAIELVELAINNGWKGFYLPKTTVQNGQQAHQTGIKSTERIKSEFILDFNQRYGRQPNEDELAMAGAIYEGAIRG